MICFLCRPLRFYIRSIPVLLLMLTLAACQQSAPPNTAPHQKITVAYTTQPQSTLIHVAAAKGYFAEQGLDIQPLIHTYGKAALQSVIDNKADFATVAETPVMFNILKGEKIFVVANIEASPANNGVVARTDAGILAPRDLKGKRVGYTPGTTSEFFLNSLLTANGLTNQDIVPVGLKPEEMQAAMMAKQVDAVSTWNYPLTQIGEQLGANGLIFLDHEIYTETFNIAARQEFVNKNPDSVDRFLRALLKAEDFVSQNPDEAQSIVATATQIDKKLVTQVWNVFDYQVALDQRLLITLEDETRWAIKNGLTDRKDMPDYRKFIYSDSLARVKPEAVKMTH
jgi:ABC-type nitrate/sulfonate/bicarbonate transport system substrate-binding protein